RRQWTSAVAKRLAAFLLIIACGCSQRDIAPETTIDLLHLFPFTDSGQETDEIHLGAAGSEAYLVRGWSAPETLPTGETVVQAHGRNALVRFALAHPADRSIHLHCAMLSLQAQPQVQPAHPLPVMVQLNGRSVAQLRLHNGFEEYTIPVA